MKKTLLLTLFIGVFALSAEAQNLEDDAKKAVETATLTAKTICEGQGKEAKIGSGNSSVSFTATGYSEESSQGSQYNVSVEANGKAKIGNGLVGEAGLGGGGAGQRVGGRDDSKKGGQISISGSINYECVDKKNK